MGNQGKQIVKIGHATEPQLRKHYRGWVESVGATGTPLERFGPTLAEARARNQLGSTLTPDPAGGGLAEVVATGAEATICSRSLALSACVGDAVIGGLLARPQLWLIDGAAPFGPDAQMKTLMRVMKLEIVTVDPLYHRRSIGSTLVIQALELLEQAHVQLVYGSFPTSQQLSPFYRSLGFEVLDKGHGISLRRLTTAGIGVTAVRGEHLFARKLGSGHDPDIVQA